MHFIKGGKLYLMEFFDSFKFSLASKEVKPPKTNPFLYIYTLFTCRLCVLMCTHSCHSKWVHGVAHIQVIIRRLSEFRHSGYLLYASWVMERCNFIDGFEAHALYIWFGSGFTPDALPETTLPTSLFLGLEPQHGAQQVKGGQLWFVGVYLLICSWCLLPYMCFHNVLCYNCEETATEPPTPSPCSYLELELVLPAKGYWNRSMTRNTPN